MASRLASSAPPPWQTSTAAGFRCCSRLMPLAWAWTTRVLMWWSPSRHWRPRWQHTWQGMVQWPVNSAAQAFRSLSDPLSGQRTCAKGDTPASCMACSCSKDISLVLRTLPSAADSSASMLTAHCMLKEQRCLLGKLSYTGSQAAHGWNAHTKLCCRCLGLGMLCYVCAVELCRWCLTVWLLLCC